MADGQNIISLGYDVDQITAQQKVVIDYLQQTLNLADQLDRRKIAPDITGQSDLNTALAKQKQVIDDLVGTQKNYKEQLDAIQKMEREEISVYEKRQAAGSAQAASLAQEKEALKQRNAEVKNMAIANSAAEGSINQLKANLNLLTQQYDKLSAAERNSASGVELKNSIKSQSDALKQLEIDTGRAQRNVGNYSSALTGYAMTLRGLRGPTKLLGEAFLGSAQAADQLRLVLEHSLQGLAAFFRHKEAKAAAEGADTASTEANTAAQAENAAATATVTTTSEAASVAIGEQATVTVAASEATEVATTATVGLGAVMTGGLILAIAAGVAALGLMIYKIYEWVEADKIAMDKQAELADAMKKTNDELNKEQDYIKDKRNQTRQLLVDELSAAQASGKSQAEILAKKKQIAAFDEETAVKLKSHSNASQEALDKLQTSYIGITAAIRTYNKELEDPHDKYKAETEWKLKDALVMQEQLKDRISTVKTALEAEHKATQEANDIKLEEEKLTAEEIRKINLETVNLEVDLTKKKNALILSDDTSSLEDRLNAIKSNGEAEKRLAEAQKNNVLNNPSSSRSDRIMAKRAAAEKEASIELDVNEQKHTQLKKDAERNMSALIAIRKSLFEAQKSFDEDSLNNSQLSYEKKVLALKDSITQEARIEDLNYQERRSKIKGSDATSKKEIEALEADHQEKIGEIQSKGTQKIIKLQEEELKRILDLKKQEFANSLSAENDKAVQKKTDLIYKQIDAYKKLSDQFLEGKISQDTYEKGKKNLDSHFSTAGVFDEMDKTNSEITLQQSQGNYKSVFQLKEHYAGLEKQLEDIAEQRRLTALKERKDKTKETLDDIVSYEHSASEAIQGIVDGQHEMELNRIQKEMDLNTKQKDLEIENITASSLSAQDKAAAIAIANANAQAKEDQLNKKKREEQVKQAQFDKNMQIFNLGIKLIIDAIEAIANPKKWLDVAADTAGMIAIAAKPIPKYAEGIGIDGKGSHPGGLAMVGEGRNIELVTTPGGNSFIADKPMVLDLPANTIVQPLSSDDINSVMYASMLQNTGRMLAGSGNARINVNNDIIGAKIDNMNRNIVRAIKDQNSSTVVNNTINLGWTEYIKKQVYN